MSPHGGIVQQSFTDDIGAASFRGISAGRYRLRISGLNVESTELSTFEINSLETVHYEYVHVTPKDNGSNAGGSGGMVSAAELNIPDKARKEFDHGVESMQKSENDKALDHFEKATAIYPQYALAYNNIGVLHVKAGEMPQARQAFETAVSVDPKLAAAYLNLARMSLNDKNYKEADQFITRALTVEPNRVEAMALAAQCKMMLGDLDSAYAFAKKVHSQGDHKAFSAVHLVAAHVLEQRHEYEQAMAEYKLFLNESPDSPTAPRVRDAIARLGEVGAAK
jgi:tetratricopeptide (TPR) repeat protein